MPILILFYAIVFIYNMTSDRFRLKAVLMLLLINCLRNNISSYIDPNISPTNSFFVKILKINKNHIHIQISWMDFILNPASIK